MKIGYLYILRDDEKYAGGIMIADERGIPIEFKYTEPVTPTKVQKVLYGDVLEKYLREEIIITNLSGKIENAPDIYVINDDRNYYLEDVVKEKVITIKNTQLKPMKEFSKQIKENEYILQANETSSPLRIMFSEDVKEEREEIMKNIAEVAKNTDITEPLTRIEEALKLICRGEL